MKTLWTAVGALSAAAMLASAAEPAAAYGRHHHYAYRNYRTSYRQDYASRDCWSEHHASANTGTVLGAGGGAVIGHQIGAHSHRCR